MKNANFISALKKNSFLFFLLIGLPLWSQGNPQKTLTELTADHSGWKTVTEWMKNAGTDVQVLSKNPEKANNNLLLSQVSTRSPMGAVIYETGGIIVKKGLIRILGSGSPEMNRGLMEWNEGKSYTNKGEMPSFLLIADDVFGGFFALNAGYFSNENIGKVYYFAPDTLAWENLEMTYSEFLLFCFSKQVDGFYDSLKWKSFEKDFAKSDSNSAFSFYPYLFTIEGKNIEETSKKLVPVAELWTLYNDLQKQFDH